VSLTGPPCEDDRRIKQFKPRFRPGYLKQCFSLELPPRVFTHVNKLLPDTTVLSDLAFRCEAPVVGFFFGRHTALYGSSQVLYRIFITMHQKMRFKILRPMAFSLGYLEREVFR